MRTLASLVPEVRVAYRTLTEGEDWSGVADLLSPLFLFAQEQVRGDVFSLMRDAADEVPSDRACILLAGSAVAAWQQGAPGTARRLARRAVEMGGEGPGARFAHLALGQVDELDGALTEAEVHGAEAARLAALIGDSLVETVSGVMRALVSAHTGDLDLARDHVGRAIDCADAAGCPLAQAWAAYGAGEIELEQNPALAAAWLDRALARSDAAGATLLWGITLLSSVTLRARRGGGEDQIATRRRFQDLIDFWQMSGMWAHQWATLRNLIVFLGQTGVLEDAARLYGAVTGAGVAFAAHGAEAARLEQTATALRHELGDDRFNALTADGASRSAGEALDLALEIVGRRSA
jgi:hypothetical protein